MLQIWTAVSGMSGKNSVGKSLLLISHFEECWYLGSLQNDCNCRWRCIFAVHIIELNTGFWKNCYILLSQCLYTRLVVCIGKLGMWGRFQFTDAPCLYAIFSHFCCQTFITVNYYFICHNCISNLVTLCYFIAYSACFHRYDILCTVVRFKLPTSAYTGHRK